MSWYLQWSDSIKKRACRYLLQRYLGQFLEEKLTLDQLSVDIYCGTGSISNVALDVQALNELGENKNLPFEFVDGFISGISVSIPWATLFTESIYVEVSGMQITIQPKQRPDSAASMLESMWSSMASSIQLAAECLKNEPPPPEEKEGENVNNMEGLEIFAQAIESILTRVKVKLVNTCIRLEHLPKEGRNGIALEVRIKNIKYCDETTCDYNCDDAAENPQLSAAVAIKKFFCDGISFYTDEFPVDARTISRSLISEEFNTRSQDRIKDQPEPVLIGKLSGYQEITLKLKMDPSAIGPKVDFELNLGSLVFFLSPRQLYLLIEIMQSLASPHTQDTSNVSSKKKFAEKMMSSRDFKKVEQDLQETLSYPPFMFGPPTPVISQGKGWSSPSFEDNEEEFLPMHLDNAMTGSVMSDNTTDTSFTSNTSGTYLSKSDSLSQHSTLLGGIQHRRKYEKGFSFDTSDMLEETCAFHMRLSSLAAVILHEDLLTLGLDTCELTPSSVATMKHLSEEFFSQLGKFAMSGNKDFEASKEAFLRSCKHNHIRLLGATVIVEGNESRNGLNSALSSFISIASLELLECLVEKSSSSSGEPQYVELLKFMNKNSQLPIRIQTPLSNQPDLRLHMQRMVKHRSSRITSCTEISLRLEQCWSELDLSIFDRISTIVTPQKLCHTNVTSKEVMDQQLSFTHAVESSTHSVKNFYFKVQSPVFVIKFRFPIPDLRPPHEKGRFPWWQRSVRKDVLYINLSDATFVSDVQCDSSVQEYHIACKELSILFQEGETDVPIPFIQASGDSPFASAADPYPRLLIRLCPTQVSGGMDDAGDKDDGSAGLSYSTFMDSSNKEPSPFMSKKVVHESDTHHRTASEGEELIIPGCKEDMDKFVEYAQEESKVHLEVVLPFLSVEFPSKHLYEVIYNRISSDLSLWQSSAPKHSGSKSGGSSSASLIHPSFSMCKSGIQYDSDESDEDDSDEDKHHCETSNNHQSQSYFTLSVKVSKGVLDVCPNLKDSKTSTVPDKFGEIYFALQEGNLFFVSNFKGRSHKNYVCLQVKSVEVFHKACVDHLTVGSKVKHSKTPPSYLDPILLKSNKEVRVTSMNPEGPDGNMLLVAVSTEVNERRMKTIRVACSLNGATLKHQVALPYRSWLTQFLDFFDVVDYPVKGYDSPQIITELYFHLWDSAVDYRPLYLPYSCVITLGNLSISSNIAARTKTSTLRFIAEEGNLFITDVTSQSSRPNLQADYVSVMQLGLFELSLRLSDQPHLPKMDLKASNNILHIRTCSDSAAALAQLITYFASDGDLVRNEKVSSPVHEKTATNEAVEDDGGQDLTESTVVHVNDMMEDAMKEIGGSNCNGNVVKEYKGDEGDSKEEDIEVFFFPDEGNGVNHNPCDWNGMDTDHDFCVVEPESGITGVKPDGLQPAIHVLIEHPVEIIENHFNISIGKSDLLRTPKCYPNPTYKYTLSDMTVVWHMYGGKDFSNKSSNKKNVKFEKREFPSAGSSPVHKPKNGKKNEDLLEACYTSGKLNQSHRVSINKKKKTSSSIDAAQWITAGGVDREHDVLMELQFNKVKFVHEIYPEQTTYASRQVLLIHEFEIRDKLSTSQINKFLYQYSSESSPRQSNANMMVIKAVHLRPDPRQNIQETCLKVSVLPLRLNIDQDSLQFLVMFFTQLSGISYSEDDEVCSAPTPVHPNPVMSVEKKEAPVEEEPVNTKDEKGTVQEKAPTSHRSPTYIRNFVFSPEVPIRIDYEGKHVDLTHGPLAGLLMGLGQLNCLQIKLKRLSYKHGLLGFDKLLTYAMNEWIQDIKKTQVPCLLGGVGPMHALVQLFQGIRDLFWLPIEQYQKDGRIVRGLQRGANSFTTSTAIAALELTARIVQAIQSIAEAAFDMVSPGPSVRRHNGSKYKKQHHAYSHPADIREGVTNAYTLVKEGLGETAETIVRVASAEAQQKGAVGAVGGVLRQIPPSVVQQLILASAATSNLLSGVRSQLAPDSRREAAFKWKKNVPE